MTREGAFIPRAMAWARVAGVAGMMAAVLAACGSQPPVPAWQLDAKGAMERYEQAWLTGADRAADAEFARARDALASTGRADLVARAELVRCALQVASLALAPGVACEGFEVLRGDASEPEKAYAAYLSGASLPADTDLARIKDPLSRLVAAGVLVRGAKGSPEVLRIAAETASQQGWRRPLLAWLGARVKLAEQAGDEVLAQQLRRRMALVAGER